MSYIMQNESHGIRGQSWKPRICVWYIHTWPESLPLGTQGLLSMLPVLHELKRRDSHSDTGIFQTFLQAKWKRSVLTSSQQIPQRVDKWTKKEERMLMEMKFQAVLISCLRDLGVSRLPLTLPWLIIMPLLTREGNIFGWKLRVSLKDFV